MEKILNQKGALLMEILLAILIGAVIIGAVSGLVLVSSKSGQNSGAKSSAIGLAKEGLEAMQSISETRWHDIFLPPDGNGDSNADKGNLKPYYLYKNGSSWALGKIVVGDEGNILIDGIIYSRKIYIENVTRDITGDGQICTGIAPSGICASGEAKDPSTQKIKIMVSKNGSTDIVLEEYLTRWKNNTFGQSDWSGGAGQANFSDPSKYNSDDGNIDASISGKIKLRQ